MPTATLALLVCPTSLARSQPANARDMIFIPGGEFEMGISDEEARQLAREFSVHPSIFIGWTPRRKVDIEPFLIDRYPVTNAQYKAFMDRTGHRAPGHWADGTYPDGMGDHPVTNMGADSAIAYAEWAGTRLPTEAEWEKAARGTDGRLYPWGNQWDDAACVVDDGSSPSLIGWTAPVGSLPNGASPYGVMDLVGNVAEWTATESQPRDEQRNWAWYVVKGAAYVHTQRYNFLCAARNFSAHQSRRHDWLGFRCAMDAGDVETTTGELRPAPPFPERPPAPAPVEDALGQPVRITFNGAFASVRVPWFPVGAFSVYCPEQATAEGLNLAWGSRHSGFEPLDEDGLAGYRVTFEKKGVLSARLQPGRDSIDFALIIRNLTDRPLTGVHTNTCLNIGGSPYFRDIERVRTFVWTDAGPTCVLRMPHHGGGEPYHNGWAIAKPGEPAPAGGDRVRHPFIFVRSRDGKWIVAQAYDEGTTVASNAHYSCLHTRPTWPDIPPGEERTRAGKLYLIQGGPNELLARWRADFANGGPG